MTEYEAGRRVAALTPSERKQGIWRAASRGAFAAVLFLAMLTASFIDVGIGKPLMALVGLVAGALIFVTLLVLIRLVLWAARIVPSHFLPWLLAAMASMVFIREFGFRFPEKFFYPGIASLLVACMLLASALWLVRKRSFPAAGSRRNWALASIAALSVFASCYWWAASPGGNPYPRERTLSSLDTSSIASTLPSPAQSGPFEWEHFTYGSGSDRRRDEYAEGVLFETDPVDLSKVLPEWKGFKKKAREWFWGFSISSAPMNARVWMPTGDGPFPLALIIHGNHGMEDYSDAGYGYLGELLASRGTILVSVDENYINGTWSGDFRGREMPARAIILLEHLKQWRAWSEDTSHAMFGKPDMERIAVLGHSRGGEAAPIVSAYNRLERFPDDATFSFDYDFSIRALVAIAPVDQRYHRRVHVDDVNFLTIQGSYDSDEPAFHGLRQMRRNHFTDGRDWFEAGVYIHRANHGQFNTTWGRRDSGPPSSWLLNLEPILPPEDQRQVAKIYISAFVESTLLGNHEYLPLFRDPRFGARWLPDVTLLAQYDDSSFQEIAGYEEDLDVTSASVDRSEIRAEHFTKWREDDVRLRDNLRQDTHALVLGWDRQGDEVPTYAIDLPDDFLPWPDASMLSFTISPSTESARPATSDSESDDTDDEPADSEDADEAPLDFAIELVDGAGEKARLYLSSVVTPAPALKVQYLKNKTLNRQRYRREWEPTPQFVEIGLARFTGVNPNFDPSTLRGVRLVFDRSSRGVMVVDDIGLRRGLVLPFHGAPIDGGQTPTDDTPATEEGLPQDK